MDLNNKTKGTFCERENDMPLINIQDLYPTYWTSFCQALGNDALLETTLSTTQRRYLDGTIVDSCFLSLRLFTSGPASPVYTIGFIAGGTEQMPNACSISLAYAFRERSEQML